MKKEELRKGMVIAPKGVPSDKYTVREVSVRTQFSKRPFVWLERKTDRPELRDVYIEPSELVDWDKVESV